ncbi:MAG: DUF45 domain-containing protein, partial [Spirochaetales bacterium]|nr:DUF45 domain-containing protein [Spirochaetales bacterium]
MHRLRFTEEKILEFKGHAVRLQKKRIKSLRLRLIPPYGEIRLSVPHWYSDSKAEEFLHSRWQWVVEQKRVIHAVHPLARQQYMEGEEILFKGKPYTLRTARGRRSSVAVAGDEILLSVVGNASSGGTAVTGAQAPEGGAPADEARKIME